MAFKTKAEKYAFVKGIKAGLKGKKPFNIKMNQKNNDFIKDILKDLKNKGITDYDSVEFVKWCKRNDFIPSNIRQEIINSNLVVSKAKTKKPVYDYSKFFSFNKNGRIKGSYNSDGFFEPD